MRQKDGNPNNIVGASLVLHPPEPGIKDEVIQKLLDDPILTKIVLRELKEL
jgi:hypothetical protein